MNAATYARPVIPILLALISGLVAGFKLPGLAVWVWFPALILLALLAYRIFHKQGAVAAPLALCILCGYLAIQPWVAPDFPANHVIHFTDTPAQHISGVVANRPLQRFNRTKFILDVTGLKPGNQWRPVQGRTRVTVYGAHPHFKRGDRVRFKGRLKSIRNFNNPGAFDYRMYMAFKRVWVNANASGRTLSVDPQAGAGGFIRAIDRTRERIAVLIGDIESKWVSPASKAVLTALLVGDRSGITPEWRMVFNRSGVGHLLAISGLHIGIIAATAFGLLRWLLSFWRIALWRAWVVKLAAGMTLMPVLFYGLLAGMSPSTQRALMMVSVFLIALVIEKDQDLLNSLCVAALLILIVNPPALFTISFQLSFAAVLGILLGFNLQGNVFKRPGTNVGARIHKSVISIGLASLFAILGTLPLVMYYFNLVSLVGWGVNFLVVPLIGFGVIPIGLLAVCFYPLHAPLAMALWEGCLVMLTHILDLIRLIADWPWAAVRTVTPSGIEIVCYYALALGVYYLVKSSRLPQTDSRLTRVFWARCMMGIVLGIICVDVGYWSYQRFWRPDLRVTAIDVGQGSATLVEVPGGHTVLIDGGGFGNNAVFDIGARVVAPLLWRKKIRTVETLVLSHPNSDHLNGLLFVAANFNVREFWANGEPADNTGYHRLIQVLKQHQIRTPTFEQLPRHHVINGVKFDILYPPVDFMQRRKSETWRSSNNNSLVIKISYGRQSALVPGDIMARGEAELVAHCGAALSSTAILAPHHGSRTSSSMGFLEKVNPQIVVISSGWRNRFGFPHPSVLARYQDHNCQIFRTDQQGAVTMVTDGSTLTVGSWLPTSPFPGL